MAKRGGIPIPRFDLALRWEDLHWMMSESKNAGREEIEKFEQTFAKFIGAKQAIYTASARGAFALILNSLNLPQHSKILIPAWTHYSIPAVISSLGFIPCLTDVKRGTWVMSPETVQEQDWEEAAAIVITNMYGCPAQADVLAAEARRRGIPVIEDCAQGFGARVHGKRTGSFGDAAIFSFALTKNFTTMGGGMAVFNNERLASIAAQLMEDAPIEPNTNIFPNIVKAAAMWTGTSRLGFTLGVYPMLAIGWAFLGKDALHQAFEEQVTAAVPDFKCKPSAAQAALGLRLLRWSDEQCAKRMMNGKMLIELFKKADIPGIGIPEYPSYGDSSFMSFVINAEQHEKLARQLYSRGIDTSPGYLKPIQQIPMFADASRYYGTLPNASMLGRTQLHIPVYPRLERDDLERIVLACADAAEMLSKSGIHLDQPVEPIKETEQEDICHPGATYTTQGTGGSSSYYSGASSFQAHTGLAAPASRPAMPPAPARPAAPPAPPARPSAPPAPARPAAPSAPARPAAPPAPARRPAAPPAPAARRNSQEALQLPRSHSTGNLQPLPSVHSQRPGSHPLRAPNSSHAPLPGPSSREQLQRQPHSSLQINSSSPDQAQPDRRS